jgi:hypothetical protein
LKGWQALQSKKEVKILLQESEDNVIVVSKLKNRCTEILFQELVEVCELRLCSLYSKAICSDKLITLASVLVKQVTAFTEDHIRLQHFCSWSSLRTPLFLLYMSTLFTVAIGVKVLVDCSGAQNSQDCLWEPHMSSFLYKAGLSGI